VTAQSAEHRLIPLAQPEAWRFALRDLPHGFGHSWESCQAMFLTTGSPTFLYQYAQGTVRIICPLAERSFQGYKDIYTPFGFSGFSGTADCEGFKHEWYKFARSRDWVCGYINLHPLLTRRSYWDQRELFEQNDLFFLDLRRSASELWNGISRSRRHQITKSMRECSLSTDKSALGEFIASNSAAFFRERGAAGNYFFTQATWEQLFDSNNVFALGVKKDGKVVATTVFGFSEHLADALFNVWILNGRESGALLMWEGAVYLKTLGIHYLNMGGGVVRHDTIAQAKRLYGASVLPHCALKQVYNDAQFRELCQLRRVEPNRVGYFPPYHAGLAR
jgi:hypothetical protein